MSRYGALVTGVVDTGDPATCDQRAWFPFEIDTAGADEIPEIFFTREEYVEYVYRVRQYTVDINLTFTTGDLPVSGSDTLQVYPNDSDELELPRNYLGLGTTIPGATPLTVPAIGQAIYIPLTKLFRINYVYSTPILIGGNAVFSQPGALLIPTAATLEIFGHVTHLYERGDLPTTGATGAIIITPTEWREYLNRDNLNPVVNSATGAQLISPAPAGYG